MEPSRTAPDHGALSRTLVEQILMTGLMLADLLADLVEGMPDDAFPGERPTEVLLEMFAGSCIPVVGGAGAEAAERAVALIQAVGDRTLMDLRAAAALAKAREAA